MVVYLDYNATTPVDPEVQETICKTLKNSWGNPSCSYDAGKDAKSVVEDARRKVAEMIGSAPHEIIFTSGGTESNNMVIETAIRHFYASMERDDMMTDRKGVKPHIITSNVEHDSIRLHLEKLVEEGKIEVTFFPVSKFSGMAVVSEMVDYVRFNTCLITLMLANNETGIIQPVHRLRSKIRALQMNNSEKQGSQNTILIHTDASQALGKIEVDVDNLDVDYLTITGHKFYGPCIGALYFRHGRPLYPLFYGGGQEKKYRPGTENTCMIAGLGKAAELVTLNLSKYSAHMMSVRDHLEKCLRTAFARTVVFHERNVLPEGRLPNTVSVAFDFDFLTGESLLAEAKEICASTGSACHSGVDKVSSVLLNSGVASRLAGKTLRLSVGRETEEKDVEAAVKFLQKAVRKLRRI